MLTWTTHLSLGNETGPLLAKLGVLVEDALGQSSKLKEAVSKAIANV